MIDKQNKINKIKNIFSNNHLNYYDNFDEIIKNHILSKQSPFYNYYHLHAFSGLINDPNNLSFFNNKFYIFYQNSPFTPYHVDKHQSLYTTKNFVNYENHFIVIAPDTKEDKNGVYSGGAIVENNTHYLFWTGNVKNNNIDKSKNDTSYTMVSEWKNNKLSKKQVLFEVDHSKYTRNFRDPKLFKIAKDYFLLHGAQTIFGEPRITVYKSKFVNKKYHFKGEIKFLNLPTEENWGYMFECPDFISINNKDILIFSTQGKNYFGFQNQNNDNSIFVIGKMNWNKLEFNVEKIQNIDLGFDFYAPQIFANYDKPIMLGWGAVPESDVYNTMDYQYAFNLTLPRELSLKNDHVYQKPLIKLKLLRKAKSKNISKLMKLDIASKEFNLKVLGDFKIEIFNQKNKNQKITFIYKNDNLKIDRSKMTYLQTEKNGLIWNRKIENFKYLNLFLDRSYLEIFINKGEYVFSMQYFLKNDIAIKFSDSIKGHYYDLKSIKFSNDIKPKTIFLPGEALIDRFTLDNKKVEKVGGAPLNVAVAINKWSIDPYFLGTIGSDVNSKYIIKFFNKFNLNKKYLQYSKTKTTVADVKLTSEGERNFEFIRGADQEFNFNISQKFDILVLSSATAFLGGQLLQKYNQLLKKANKNNLLVIFDPNYRDALYANNILNWKKIASDFLFKSTIVKLSLEELELLSSGSSLEKKAQNLIKNKTRLILVTLGAKGTLAVTKNEYEIINSIKVNQKDSTGAGDAFLGNFIGQISYLNLDWENLKISSIINIIKKSNIAAALTTEKIGGASSIPSLIELNKRWEEENGY